MAAVCRSAIALLLFALGAFAHGQTGQVAAGGYHSLALQPNGTLWAWGDNSLGQLGDGTSTSRTRAVPIGSGYSAIAAGLHSLALKSDGSLWAWGYNNNGQLGDGTITNRSAPKLIGTGYQAIAAGGYHTLAIKSDGSLWSWGDNYWGQLGHGTTTESRVPKQVGTATNWVAVAAGTFFSLALDSSGGLWSWGYNSDFQLGNRTTTYRSTPLQFTTGYSAVAAGSGHAAALSSGGALYTWGNNNYGQLGDNSTADRSTLYNVGTGYAAAAPGGYHTLGLKSDGSLWAWGSNTYGQLGNGTTTSSYIPVRIGTATDWVALSASSHSLALKSDGSVWAWGYNPDGQVGNGSTLNQRSPTQVLEASGAALNLSSATASYTLKTTVTGSGVVTSTPGAINCGLSCSGIFSSGTLVTLNAAPASGYRLTGWSGACTGTGDCTVTMDQAQTVNAAFGLIPVPALSLSASSLSFANQVLGSASAAKTVTLTNTGTASLNIASIAVSGDFIQTNNCGSSRAAGVSCTISVKFVPSAIAPSAGALTITSDAPGSPHVVALSGTGVNGLSSIAISGPAAIDEGSSALYSIVASYADASSATVAGSLSLAATTYASLSGATLSAGTVTADRTVTLNASYSEGGVTKTASLAVTIRNTGNVLTGIAIVGPASVDEGASVKYEIRATYDDNSTATVSGSFSLATTPYASVSGATLTANAVPADRVVLLNATYTEGAVTRAAALAVRVKDVPASASGVWKIAAGADHTFAIKGDGSLWAWGINNHGQLGDGTKDASIVPKRIGGGFTDIAAGVWHTVALKSDGSLWTWGSNAYGQLGDPSVTESATPARIGTDFFSSIAAGYHHTLAIKTDGSLWVWGYNASGQLGDGGTANSGSPKQIGTGFLAVAAGSAHTLALKSDGTLWAWGENSSGQLGDGGTNDSHAPKQIGSGYVSISARGYGSIAVKADGSLWEWGRYEYISLGPESQGAVTSSTSPRQMGNGFVFVEAGHDHNLAMQADNTLWVWGNNYYGQLANGGGGYNGDSMTPRQIEGEYRAVAAGYGHTVALKSDGSLWAWGYGSYGELGNNTTQGAPLPVPVTIKDLLGAPDSLKIEAPAAIGGGTTEVLRAIGIWGTDSSPVSPITWSIVGGSAGAISETGIFIAKSVTQDETVIVRGTLATAERSVSADQAIRVTPSGVDTSPDPLSFNFITVSMNTWCTSNPVQISGIGAPAMIRVEGGFYSVDNGVTWSGDKPGTVAPGAIVMLGTTAPSANQVKRVTAYVGDQVGVFGVSTFASSGVPAPIAFAGRTGVAADADIDSDQSEPVTSLSTAAAISVSGPGAQYSTDGGAFTAAAGTLNPGARVTLRVRSSAVAGETVTAMLNVGGILSPFNVTTAGGSESALPDDFAFAYTAHSSVALDSLMTSNTILVKGLVAATAAIRIENGEYSVNRGPWTSAPGSVKNGDLVALRLRSSASNATPSSALVFIGGMMKVFNVTTMPAGGTSNIDDTPSPFPFPPQTGVTPGTQVASIPVSVLGISHGTTIKADGGEYRIVNAAAGIDTGFVSYESYVELGDQVSLRQTASALPLTTTTATLTIGTRSEGFDVTTADTAPSTTTTSATTTTTVPATTSTTTTTTSSTTTSSAPTTTVPAASSTTTTTTMSSTTSTTTAPTTSTTGTTTTTASASTSTTTTSSTTLTTAAPTTSTISTTTSTTTSTTSSTTSTTQIVTADLAVGWNLVGNGWGGAIDVAASFGDSARVNTVWKWVSSKMIWAFYAPSLSAQQMSDYAASKGYDVLTSIEAGDGFWVNAKEAFAIQSPSGAAVSTGSLQSTLVQGWNLVAVGDRPTPSQFNSVINLTTLWAWDNVQSNWYFYAPSLEKTGALAAYIQQKNYLDFGGKVLDPATGFWVNKP